MLQYKSELLRIIDTFVFSPLLLSGFSHQKQSMTIEFYSDYRDDAVSVPHLQISVTIWFQSIGLLVVYNWNTYCEKLFFTRQYLQWHHISFIEPCKNCPVNSRWTMVNKHPQQFLSSRNSVGGDIVMWPFVCGWVSDWVAGRHVLPRGHDSN